MVLTKTSLVQFVESYYFLFAENFYKIVGDRCKCPVPCEIISFKPVLSYANFPSDIFLKTLIKRNLKNATDDEIGGYITLAKLVSSRHVIHLLVWSNGDKVDASFQLPSTCISVWPGRVCTCDNFQEKIARDKQDKRIWFVLSSNVKKRRKNFYNDCM